MNEEEYVGGQSEEEYQEMLKNYVQGGRIKFFCNNAPHIVNEVERTIDGVCTVWENGECTRKEWSRIRDGKLEYQDIYDVWSYLVTSMPKQYTVLERKLWPRPMRYLGKAIDTDASEETVDPPVIVKFNQNGYRRAM